MEDELCAYEVARLAQVEENRKKLQELGIEPVVPKQPVMRRTKQYVRKDNVNDPPPRRQPPRGNGQPKDYADFYALQSDILDRIDENEKKKPRAAKRKVKDLVRSSEKKRTYTNKALTAGTLADDGTSGRASPNLPFYDTFVASSDSALMSKHRLRKWYDFKFTVSHIEDSGGSKELMDEFQHFCDCNAHIRYLESMNKGRSKSFNPEDVCAVAKAITANADLSSFDTELVTRYNSAVADFKGHPGKLDLNVKTSTNPLLICPFCKGSYTCKKNGKIRDHNCM